MFNQTTINSRTWAVDASGVALSDTVTTRWLTETCPRCPAEGDENDRKQFKNGPALQT
ncbi:hypothetical protein [Candidatus Binatus sp.]|uniref:hypothetical protein n=1 Tax=Candidatus Binatus sp. TaxID=2811406 RepID=UPI003BE956E1